MKTLLIAAMLICVTAQASAGWVIVDGRHVEVIMTPRAVGQCYGGDCGDERERPHFMRFHRGQPVRNVLRLGVRVFSFRRGQRECSGGSCY